MHRKLILTTLLAAVALTAATGVASANRSIGVNESRYTLTGESLLIVAEPARIVCAATITHTITRAIAKTEGTLAGRFTEFRTAGCVANEGVTFRALRFLIGREENGNLWKFFYRSFAGTLPNIVRISYRLSNVLILIEVSVLGTPFACLYEGNGIYFWGFGGEGDEDNETLNLARTLLGTCPERASVSGLFTITPALRVTLL